MRRYQAMGGGSMLRSVGRVVGAGMGGVQEALSSAAASAAAAAKPTRLVSVSSPSSSSSSSPSFSAADWRQSYRDACLCEGDGWESVAEEEIEEGGFGLYERRVFEPAPSREEVVEAVSTIQQIFVPVKISHVTEDEFPPSNKDVVGIRMASTDTMHRVSSAESELDWIEPALQLYRPKTVESQGRDRVLDAFRLLQINPSIQRTVVSLSSDKAVWDAVMKNEAVQELRKAFSAESSKSQRSDEETHIAAKILRWILHNAKAKIIEVVDKISKIVNELFHLTDNEKKMDHFEDALRSSFMLSVFVLIIVLMARANGN